MTYNHLSFTKFKKEFPTQKKKVNVILKILAKKRKDIYKKR